VPTGLLLFFSERPDGNIRKLHPTSRRMVDMEYRYNSSGLRVVAAKVQNNNVKPNEFPSDYIVIDVFGRLPKLF